MSSGQKHKLISFDAGILDGSSPILGQMSRAALCHPARSAWRHVGVYLPPFSFIALNGLVYLMRKFAEVDLQATGNRKAWGPTF